jgi:cytochrome P450
VLSKHADISALELDGRGTLPFTTSEGLFLPEAKRPELIEARDPGGAQRAGLGFHSDPPQHARFRRLVTDAFAPRRLSDLAPIIEAVADELLDELPEDEPVDFVEAFSAPLAIRVIAEFLGIPRERWGDMARWTDAQTDLAGGSLAEGSPEAQRAVEDMEQMYAYLREQLAERARAPRADFMSTVATAELDGEPLPDASQLHTAFGVLTAGNDTIANLLSAAMVTFTEHPDQWQKLLAEPALVPNAVEELLRWNSPVIGMGRRATEPFVIRDQQIGKGDFLFKLFDAANRDEEVWPDAETFDVTRDIRPSHLALGWGIHHCVGANLARNEIRIALERLVERFRSWELAGPPVRTPSTVVQTYLHVPVVLKRAEARSGDGD